MTNIKTSISDLTGIDENKFRIRVETNENNEVIRIIVVVDDKETAEKISTSINVAIDEHNEEGIIRHFTSARVIVKENKLSISGGTMKKEDIIVMFTIVFISFFTIHNHLW